MSDKIYTIILDKNGKYAGAKAGGFGTLVAGTTQHHLTAVEIEEMRIRFYEKYSLDKQEYDLNASKALWSYLQTRVYK